MSKKEQSGKINNRNLLMIACMLAPLLVLGYFVASRWTSFVPVNGVWLILLICPLMHLLMMKGILGGRTSHGSCHGNKENRLDNHDSENIVS